MTKKEGKPWPLGAEVKENRVNFAVEAPPEKTCELLLYKKGEKDPELCIDMPRNEETGAVRFLSLEDFPAREYEYSYRVGEEIFVDPYAGKLSGTEKFHEIKTDEEHQVRGVLYVDDYDWEGCAARDTAQWDRKNKLSNVILINGMFESLHMFCGFENALCNIITDEDASADFMGAMADYKIEVIRRIKKYYNADKIQFHDDYANNSSLFMDIPRWRRLIRPHLKRVIDATHECGMYYEHHSCGMIRDLVGELTELGVDALNPVQLQNDPLRLKQTYGDRLTIAGGFDNQGCLDRVDATEEELKDSLRATLEAMAPGGKWIARVSFLDKSRDQLWLDVLDAYNRPLKERMGVAPTRHTASGKDLYDLSKRTGSTKIR